MSSGQYVATRPFPTAHRQYEIGDMIDTSRISSSELNAGVISGAIEPAKFIDTAARLAAVNPVLGPGVHAYETDTGVHKIGTDGVTRYNSLGQVGNGTYASIEGVTRDARMAALRPFHAALAARETAQCNVVFLGDSIPEGSGQSSIAARWINRFQDRLRQRYPITTAQTSPVSQPPRWSNGPTGATAWSLTAGGGSASTALGNFGLGGRYASFSGNGLATLSGLTCTGLDVFYAKGTTGVLGVAVDGGAETTVNTASGTTQDGFIFQVRSLANASHSVVIRHVSGQSIVVGGVKAYIGDEGKGIHLYDLGHGGWKASDFNSTAYNLRNITAIQPSMIVVNVGANERFGNIAPATFQTELTNLINTAKGYCTAPPCIVLTTTVDVPGSYTYPWSDYAAVMAAVAAADPTILPFNLGLRMPGPATNSYGMFSSTTDIHPTDAGASYYADALLAAVALPA